MPNFMQPQISFEDFATVEARDGTSSTFPADLLSALSGRVTYRGRRDFAEAAADAAQYCEWIGAADVRRIIVRPMFGARLSAPGYMDCTEWSCFETEEAAARDLYDTFGGDYEADDPDGADFVRGILSEVSDAAVRARLEAEWAADGAFEAEAADDDDEADDSGPSAADEAGWDAREEAARADD